MGHRDDRREQPDGGDERSMAVLADDGDHGEDHGRGNQRLAPTGGAKRERVGQDRRHADGEAGRQSESGGELEGRLHVAEQGRRVTDAGGDLGPRSSEWNAVPEGLVNVHPCVDDVDEHGLKQDRSRDRNPPLAIWNAIRWASTATPTNGVR